MAGILGSLLEIAPGVAAQGLAGFNQGTRDRQEEERKLRAERRLREQMMVEAAEMLRKAEREQLQDRTEHAERVAELTMTPGVTTLGSILRDDATTTRAAPGGVSMPGDARQAFDPLRSGGLPSAASPDRRRFSIPDPSGGATEFEFTPPPPAEEKVNWQTSFDAEGNAIQVNPRTGETRPLGFRRAVDTDAPGSVNLQRFTGGDGFIYTFNPRTRETQPVLGPDGQPMRAPVMGGRATEAQNKMRVALPRAEDALAQIEQFLGYDRETGSFAEGGGDVPEESLLGRFLPGRYLQSEDVQAYDRAAEAVASAILRVESGAAITDSELESYKRQFVPRPGDKPEVIRQKLNALRMTLDAIRQSSGLDPLADQGAAGADPLDRADFF